MFFKKPRFPMLPILLFCMVLLSKPQAMGESKNSPPAPPPGFRWKQASPESQGISASKLEAMTRILAEKGTRKLLIIKNDKIIHEWYARGWEDTSSLHHTASLAKALVGGMSLAAAISDGFITLDEAACHYIPEWKKQGIKQNITIRHLATHTSGIEDAEANPEEQKAMPADANMHSGLPGWKGAFWRRDPNPFEVSREKAPVIFTPGEKYAYSNPGIAMLTYAVTAALKDSEYSNIRSYLRERIYEPIGIKENEYNLGYGKTFETGDLQLVPSWGGANFTARAVARIGRLMLHKGVWQGKQVIDASVVEKVTRYAGTALPKGPSEFKGNIRREKNPVPATTAGWYCNFDGVWNHVPRDAFAGAGAGNQHLFVIPSLDMVVVRMGDNLSSQSKGAGFWLGAEKYLLNPLMDAIEEPPYPRSPITAEFAPKDSILRLAEGSDNFPATRGKEGNLYTAYGDGWGFVPRTEIKLSLGLAKVSGNPPGIKGTNIRSHTGERVGAGRLGKKASGLLMVDGVLYMLVRNADNAQLMWSHDQGKTWEQAGWKFRESFGCPVFLNFGNNYEGARDDYVYIYSHEEASAYKNSDHFVLARVPRNQVRNWRKYEYFAGYKKGADTPLWSEDIRKRAPVFTNPAKCYRSGITYNKGMKKYLWCQTIRSAVGDENGGARFRGGLGIFESSNPWGPWKTVYYTREWDTGPGETSSIPTKWMHRDGKTAYLLFSGNDSFSIRKITFSVD